jgi:sugar phosphate isomerase/epimerase
MNRLSINEMTTFRWTFDEDVTHYREAGIEAIGVWRQKLSDFGEERGVDLLAESGLAVSNLLWAGGFTGSEGRNFRESIEDAEEAIRLAAAMQAGSLVLYSGARNGHTHNHARRLMRAALTELVPVAADREVHLALELMHARCATEWTFLTDLGQAIDLIGEIGSPHLKLAFDTYHLGHDEQILGRIAELAPHTVVVHLGDSKELPDQDQNRCPLGEGSLPLRAMVRGLIDAGYQGYFDVELMGEEIENSDYRSLIAQSKTAFDEMVAC